MDDELDKYFENGEKSADESDSDSENEYSENEEDITNEEYEFDREEPISKSPKEFAEFLQNVEYPDEITKYLKSIKLFERNEVTANIVPTKSLTKTVKGFCCFLIESKLIKKPILRGIAKLFGKYDMFHYVSTELSKRCLAVKKEKMASWFNIFNFLSFVPHPVDELTKPLFTKFCKRTPFNTKILKKRRTALISNDWENVWMAVMNSNINSKVSLKMIPHITEHVMPRMIKPFKTADFFFKMFDLKGVHSVLSLSAIFKLITEHNFEYPKFYEKVYSMTQPSLLYMTHKEKVITLMDTILSSTHVPIYIVASFIKKLTNCLILAPIDAQEPILGLIRNLLIRHPNCSELIHKEVPLVIKEDPFQSNETELNKTSALESSLWELDALKQHWSQNVRKRAHFADSALQKMESFIRFRDLDSIFSMNMAKSFGGEEGEAEKYNKLQDGEEEDESPSFQPPREKSRKKGGKYAEKHSEKVERTVAWNTEAPRGILERKAESIDTPVLWKI